MYVLTNFETSAMAAVMSTWPTTELRGCRFHLGLWVNLGGEEYNKLD